MANLDNEYLEDARGTYIGPVDRDEALNAIRGHTTGPVIVDFPAMGFAGGDTIRASGYQAEAGAVDDDDETAVFVFSDHQEVPLVGGMLYRDAVVLDLASEAWTAEIWTGGLDIRFEAGPEAAGPVVRLVFWHGAYSVMPDGDWVPGLNFASEVEPDARTDDPEGSDA